ncbi:MAG: lipase family alpha/beta hydrolase [Vulcanimicrobiota bacterium]
MKVGFPQHALSLNRLHRTAAPSARQSSADIRDSVQVTANLTPPTLSSSWRLAAVKTGLRVGLLALNHVGTAVHVLKVYNQELIHGQGGLGERLSQARSKSPIEVVRDIHHGTKPMPERLEGPAVRLERPFMLVPGFKTARDRCENLVEHLTADGQNGGRPYYLFEGGCYLDPECTQKLEAIPEDAKVFVTFFDQWNSPPDQSHPQVDRHLNQISDALDTDKVDVMGYSMGGLASRAYLDQGGKRIGKLLQVGTPNHGAGIARVARTAVALHDEGRSVNFLLNLKALHSSDAPALDWLMPDAAGENPRLDDLNSRWPQQKAAVEDFAIVGAAHGRGLTELLYPTSGDGLVEESSLHLEGVEVKLVASPDLSNHSYLLTNPEVFQHAVDFFGWKPVSD